MEADGSQAKGGFPVVDDGEYFVKVERAIDGITKTKRKKVDLLLNIEDASGVKIGSMFHTVTFIPKGEPGHGIWLHVNHCFGLPYDGQLDFDTNEYHYQSCKAYVIQETYEGKTRNKVKYFIAEEEILAPEPARLAPAKNDRPPIGNPPQEEPDESPVPY